MMMMMMMMMMVVVMNRGAPIILGVHRIQTNILGRTDPTGCGFLLDLAISDPAECGSVPNPEMSNMDFPPTHSPDIQPDLDLDSVQS